LSKISLLLSAGDENVFDNEDSAGNQQEKLANRSQPAIKKQA